MASALGACIGHVYSVGESTQGILARHEELSGEVVTSVASGKDFSVAVKLGRGVESLARFWSDLNAVDLVSAAEDIRVLELGERHAVALSTVGQVYTIGDNHYGQSGLGTAEPVTRSLRRVSKLSSHRIVGVAAGDFHSLAVSDSGAVYAWGRNAEGQCVHLAAGPARASVTLAPQVVSSLPASGAVAVAAGSRFSAALVDGAVWTWGANECGQCGMPRATCCPRAVCVLGPAGGACAAARTCQSPVIAIAAGGSHVLALESSGVLWAWGLNNRGQLGLGSLEQYSGPQRVALPDGLPGIVRIAAGAFHSAMVTEDGSAWVWGAADHGRLLHANGELPGSQAFCIPDKAAVLAGLPDATGVVHADRVYELAPGSRDVPELEPSLAPSRGSASVRSLGAADIFDLSLSVDSWKLVQSRAGSRSGSAPGSPGRPASPELGADSEPARMDAALDGQVAAAGARPGLDLGASVSLSKSLAMDWHSPRQTAAEAALRASLATTASRAASRKAALHTPGVQQAAALPRPAPAAGTGGVCAPGRAVVLPLPAKPLNPFKRFRAEKSAAALAGDRARLARARAGAVEAAAASAQATFAEGKTDASELHRTDVAAEDLEDDLLAVILPRSADGSGVDPAGASLALSTAGTAQVMAAAGLEAACAAGRIAALDAQGVAAFALPAALRGGAAARDLAAPELGGTLRSTLRASGLAGVALKQRQQARQQVGGGRALVLSARSAGGLRPCDAVTLPVRVQHPALAQRRFVAVSAGARDTVLVARAELASVMPVSGPTTGHTPLRLRGPGLSALLAMVRSRYALSMSDAASTIPRELWSWQSPDGVVLPAGSAPVAGSQPLLPVPDLLASVELLDDAGTDALREDAALGPSAGQGCSSSARMLFAPLFFPQPAATPAESAMWAPCPQWGGDVDELIVVAPAVQLPRDAVIRLWQRAAPCAGSSAVERVAREQHEASLPLGSRGRHASASAGRLLPTEQEIARTASAASTPAVSPGRAAHVSASNRSYAGAMPGQLAAALQCVRSAVQGMDKPALHDSGAAGSPSPASWLPIAGSVRFAYFVAPTLGDSEPSALQLALGPGGASQVVRISGDNLFGAMLADVAARREAMALVAAVESKQLEREAAETRAAAMGEDIPNFQPLVLHTSGDHWRDSWPSAVLAAEEARGWAGMPAVQRGHSTRVRARLVSRARPDQTVAVFERLPCWFDGLYTETLASPDPASRGSEDDGQELGTMAQRTPVSSRPSTQGEWAGAGPGAWSGATSPLSGDSEEEHDVGGLDHIDGRFGGQVHFLWPDISAASECDMAALTAAMRAAAPGAPAFSLQVEVSVNGGHAFWRPKTALDVSVPLVDRPQARVLPADAHGSVHLRCQSHGIPTAARCVVQLQPLAWIDCQDDQPAGGSADSCLAAAPAELARSAATVDAAGVLQCAVQLPETWAQHWSDNATGHEEHGAHADAAEAGRSAAEDDGDGDAVELPLPDGLPVSALLVAVQVLVDGTSATVSVGQEQLACSQAGRQFKDSQHISLALVLPHAVLRLGAPLHRHANTGMQLPLLLGASSPAPKLGSHIAPGLHAMFASSAWHCEADCFRATPAQTSSAPEAAAAGPEHTLEHTRVHCHETRLQAMPGGRLHLRARVDMPAGAAACLLGPAVRLPGSGPVPLLESAGSLALVPSDPIQAARAWAQVQAVPEQVQPAALLDACPAGWMWWSPAPGPGSEDLPAPDGLVITGVTPVGRSLDAGSEIAVDVSGFAPAVSVLSALAGVPVDPGLIAAGTFAQAHIRGSREMSPEELEAALDAAGLRAAASGAPAQAGGRAAARQTPDDFDTRVPVQVELSVSAAAADALKAALQQAAEAAASGKPSKVKSKARGGKPKSTAASHGTELPDTAHLTCTIPDAIECLPDSPSTVHVSLDAGQSWLSGAPELSLPFRPQSGKARRKK